MKKNRKRFKAPLQVVIFEGSKIILDRIFEEYPIVVGRSPKCDISFPNYDFISKQHSAIVEANNELVMVDLESSNGVYFHGKRTKRAPVTEDTIISIGPLSFKFKVMSADFAQAPTIVNSKPELDFKEDKKPSLASVQAPKKSSSTKHTQLPETRSEAQALAEPTVVSANKNKQQKKTDHAPVLAGGLEIVAPHPMAGNLKPNQRILEGFVTWKGDLYDLQQFYPGEKATVGRGPNVGLSIPTLTKRADIAFFDGTKAQCYIPPGAVLKVRNQHREFTMEELMKSQAITKWQSGYMLKLGSEDLASFTVGHDIEVHFRYAPLTKRLSNLRMRDPDEEIKKSTLVSGFIHMFITALALLNAPPVKAPKIPNVPERIARLLVEPPRQLIPVKPPEPPKPPEPEPKREPEKIVKKEPPKKIIKKIVQQKPKKVILTKTPVIKQVEKPVPTPPKKPEVNVNTLGPLAALSAMNKNVNQPVAVNINKNAGGPSQLKTSGVIGTLQTNSGKLQAGGVQSVKTKGLGVGTGEGYGIQGLKGTAGARGVAGSVVGTPKLLSVGADEGLTRAQVMAVVKKYLGEMQQCYERSLFQTPGLAGKVEYEWEITAQGNVTVAKVKSSQMTGADAMNSCVTAIFKKMKFPVAKNGQNTVPSLPLEFGKL